jgi:hypothetical protein
MQFRARLAQVSGNSPRSDDSPNVITVKLEPMSLPEADWLFSMLGCYLVVEVNEAPAAKLPMEEEIEKVLNGKR